MAETLQNISNVINSWNEKLQLNSLELSKFVPMFEIFAVSDSEIKKEHIFISDKEELRDSIQVKIKTDNEKEGEIKYITHIFSLLRTQTQTKDNTLINKRGVAGIKNASATYQDPQLGTIDLTVNLEVADLKNELKINPLFRKFIVLYSDWLILYGWNRNNVGKPLLINGDTIDLTQTNGYHKFILCTLQRINNINAKNTGETEISVTFLSKALINMFVGNIHDINNDFKKLMSKNAELENFPIVSLITDKKNLPESIRNSSSISLLRNFDSKDGNKKIKNNKIKQQVHYYYLGWIFETLKYFINGRKEKGIIDNIIYGDFFNENQTSNIRIDEDKKKNIQSKNIKSIAEIPVNITILEKYLYNNQYSIKGFLVNVLREINDIFNCQIYFKLENKTLTVFDYNKILKERNDFIEINYGASNSLLEDVNFSSMLDSNLFFGLNVLLGDDKGKKIIYNIARSLKNDEKSYLGKIYNEILPEGAKETADTSKTFSEYMNKNEVDKIKVFTEVMTSTDLSVGNVLRNYFQDLTFTIHGTVDISSFFMVKFNNFIEGIDGIYSVKNVTDNITSKSFHTVLECTMHQPDFQIKQ